MPQPHRRSKTNDVLRTLIIAEINGFGVRQEFTAEQIAERIQDVRRSRFITSGRIGSLLREFTVAREDENGNTLPVVKRLGYVAGRRLTYEHHPALWVVESVGKNKEENHVLV